MTNAEKFREVFKYEANTDTCPFEGMCHDCCIGNEDVPCWKLWWNSEYEGVEKCES